jgi:hypothetical protein
MKYAQFEQFLDEDLSWRKVEISSLIFIVKNTNEEVVLKSIILLLYAHWEGYIKKSSKLYIKYISDKNVRLGDLCGNFKAVALKNYISRCLETKERLTMANEIIFIEKYLKLEARNFSIDIDMNNDFGKEIIDTESNLKPKVFKNIISILGLNYKKAVETRERYIDSHLLANRNLIGHGSKYENSVEDFALTIKDVEKLKDIIFSIIDNFRDELLEYVRNEFFLKSKNNEKIVFDENQEKQLEKIFQNIENDYS